MLLQTTTAQAVASAATQNTDVAFFLIVHPESPARVAVAAIEACSRWDPRFIRGQYLPRLLEAAE